MTHKPPQGIDAENLIRDKIEAVARMWYATEPSAELRAKLTRGLIEKLEAAIIPALAAPPDPRKDLEALEELVAKWRGLRGVDWSAEPDGWKVTFNVCADELEQRLAEMRGAKR